MFNHIKKFGHELIEEGKFYALFVLSYVRPIRTGRILTDDGKDLSQEYPNMESSSMSDGDRISSADQTVGNAAIEDLAVAYTVKPSYSKFLVDSVNRGEDGKIIYRLRAKGTNYMFSVTEDAFKMMFERAAPKYETVLDD